MEDNAYLDIQAAWRRTIGHWWFLLAAFPSVVGEVVRFLVSVLLLFVAGDAYTGANLFLPELSLYQLPPSGWPLGPWFWARVPEVVSTYLLGWLLVGLLPARQRHRPHHAVTMLWTACVFVGMNLATLALTAFVFRYDRTTLTAGSWVLLVVHTFNLPVYCLGGLVMTLAEEHAGWPTMAGIIILRFLVLLAQTAGRSVQTAVPAWLVPRADIPPLLADLLVPIVTTGILTTSAVVAAAVATVEQNLWKAARNTCSLLATHPAPAATAACLLLLTDQTVGSVLANTLAWLTAHRIPVPAAGGRFSLPDVQFFVTCVLVATVSETVQRRSGTSRASVPVTAGPSVRRRLTVGFLVVALVTAFLLLQGTAVTHVTTLHGSSANWTARYTVAVRQRPGAAELVWRTALNASPTGDAASFPGQVHFELKDAVGFIEAGTLVRQGGRWMMTTGPGWSAGGLPVHPEDAILVLTWDGSSERVPLHPQESEPTLPTSHHSAARLPVC